MSGTRASAMKSTITIMLSPNVMSAETVTETTTT